MCMKEIAVVSECDIFLYNLSLMMTEIAPPPPTDCHLLIRSVILLLYICCSAKVMPDGSKCGKGNCSNIRA